MSPDHALANYFRRKQFCMGQRFVRERIVSSLSAHGMRADDVERAVSAWQAQGLIRQHNDATISLTPAAYPHVAP